MRKGIKANEDANDGRKPTPIWNIKRKGNGTHIVSPLGFRRKIPHRIGQRGSASEAVTVRLGQDQQAWMQALPMRRWGDRRAERPALPRPAQCPSSTNPPAPSPGAQPRPASPGSPRWRAGPAGWVLGGSAFGLEQRVSSIPCLRGAARRAGRASCNVVQPAGPCWCVQ